MPLIDATYLAHQRKRWMRPNAHLFIRADWRRFVRPGQRDDHPFAQYERKYRPDQLRDDHGRWADEGARLAPEQTQDAADIQSILDKAKQLAISNYSSKYLRCLDLCAPILERFQPKGSDINEWTYRRCIAACMGR